MNEKRQLALITGGSSGIGLALAKKYAQQGYDVGVLARDLPKLENAQQEIVAESTQKGQKISTLSCDITNYEDLSQKLRAWVNEFGIPDLVINSAGVAYPGYFQELDLEIFHWLMDVNYFGTLNVIKYLTPDMIQRGSGTLVNISSQAGFVGVFGYSAYGASKYALRGMTDVLRSEMKPLGIKVHIVFPPDTQTPQLEFEENLKPYETRALAGASSILSADQVAEAVMKGVSKGKYVIIPGFEGKLLYRLFGILGNLTYPVMDWLIKKAQKEK